MSMTREEAIKRLESIQIYMDTFEDEVAMEIAIRALRPVSRELVEKVWRGEWKLIGAGKNGRGGIWNCTRCEKSYPYKCDFCPRCGAPMTDEAVQMVMERMEALQSEIR